MNQPRSLTFLITLTIIFQLSSQAVDDSASAMSTEGDDFYLINLKNIETDYEALSSEEQLVLAETGPTEMEKMSYTIDEEPLRKRINVFDVDENPKMETIVIVNAVGVPLHNQSQWLASTNATAENTTEKLFHPYRYTAVILRKGSVFANGALISDKLVLTAAGPFFNIGETLRLFRIRLGSLDYKKGGTLLPIKSAEIHPSYIQGKPDFDVALLLIPVSVQFSKTIEPTVLSRTSNGLLDKFLTSYWPRLIVNNKRISPFAQERVKSNRMRVSLQSMLDWDSCYSELKKEGTYLDESSLCLKPPVTHHSQCMPDVGAPIVAEDGLWGVTSGWISENCTSSPSPVIFTRITTPVVNYWLELRMLTQKLQ